MSRFRAGRSRSSGVFSATYRLQLTPDFGFAQVRELVPYLRELGISHLYLSPSLQARAGSQHGYDVVDPRHVSDALGGEDELRALAGEGLGIVLDIVPNHMAAVDESPFWRDLQLRQMFFDVDLHSGFHRRFFDVSELGGLKQEDWEVFWATHAKVIELVRDGVVDGVRVDHPDGLADPGEYFERLTDAGVEHIWAEKILEPGEELRSWPIEGTTGYEFLNDVMALCVNRDAEGALTELYESLHLEVDVDNLPLALASFHVYRTYIRPSAGTVEAADRAEIGRANVSEELRRILFLQQPGNDEFVVRFQQTTGPVTAKGVEDTAFYRYFRLAALNEVGGSPARFGLSVEEFHHANERRAARFPRHLLTTYTHDTKRSPDVRSRIVALTWLVDEWSAKLAEWRVQLGPLDDPREEVLVLQTLVGAAPIERPRLDAYLEKALREGKVNTNWLSPNLEHEARVKEWAARASTLVDGDLFLDRVREIGRRLALSQLFLKLVSPGVADIYRGDELEDLSLVDPDNRRPVDWSVRRAALDALVAGTPPHEQTLKLYVTWRTLRLRAEHAEAFAGAYEPVDLGPGVCAFVRGGAVLAAAAFDPYVTPRAPDGWHDVLAVDGLLCCLRGL
jgi:(1->4)-alpha-D-glucan 1-alpha-D-glucosylmutase